MGRDSRSQRGETLVEMLLTVFIMATVLLALLTMLMTVVVASAGHRGAVSAGNQATTISEAIDRLSYTACGPSSDPAGSYGAALANVAPGYTAEIVSVRYLQSRTSPTPSYGAACPGGGNDQGTQLVTVQVKMTVPPGSKARVNLVKRDQTCPAGMSGQLAAGQMC